MNLNDKEKKLLSSLYKLGNATVREISRDTFINRTTLYPILDKLLVNGLVSKVNVENKIVYKPIKPQEFSDWAKRRKEKVEEENDVLLEWIKNQETNKKPTLVSDISYFEGQEGVQNLFSDTWRNNDEKVIYAITDYKSAYDTMGNFLRQNYLPTRVKHGVRAKILAAESEIARQEESIAKKLLRETKFLPIFEDLQIDLNIYDDKVAFFAFDNEKPSGVLIKNEKIASAMKKIFEHIWDTSKK